jgi:hypothetical protein
MRGVFLDLRINFAGGTLTAFGPPKLLSPYEALSIFAERDLAARAFLPINLSLIAERLVAAALQAPLIRTGPRPAGKPRKSPLYKRRRTPTHDTVELMLAKR